MLLVRIIAFLCLTKMSASAASAPLQTLDAYLDAYFLAEGKVADFDRELAAAPKKSGLLQKSKTYRELLALRILLESHAHSIEEWLKQKSGNEPEAQAFLYRLQSLSSVDRLAGADLVATLEPLPMALPSFYFSLEEELRARRAQKSQLSARIALARLSPALREEMKTLASSLDFASAKAPPARKIQPSPGREGNINGSSFPVNTWALTFDDGPHKKYTPLILENLSTFRKRASFLWLVECLEQVPELPAQAQALGMSLNNHSWTHENLDKSSGEVLVREITQSTERETQIYRERPSFFRLPYGAGLTNRNVRQLIADNGMIHVFWNVDSLDWKDKNPESILARVKTQMESEKRGIILFHDIHPQSVEATKLLLKHSTELDHGPKALRWVTLPEIVDELNAK